jgi:hypothetical protein
MHTTQGQKAYANIIYNSAKLIMVQVCKTDQNTNVNIMLTLESERVKGLKKKSSKILQVCLYIVSPLQRIQDISKTFVTDFVSPYEINK